MARAVPMFETIVFIFWTSTSAFSSVLGLKDSSPHALESLNPPRGQWTPCGEIEGLCKCCDRFAECTDDWSEREFFGDIQPYIPPFHENVTALILGSISLWAIRTDDFFQNVTNVTHLDLRKNTIRYISPNAFRSFNQLRVLDFSGNAMDFDSLRTILAVPTLEELDLSNTFRAGDFADNDGIRDPIGPIPAGLFTR
ncbi:hypothetical protein BaRGS_00025569 [Batillaria attramentaria]|uniref:Uncharacterized protein n=1 Tax=Batillaria attramentaria TaxID=370345 RepID=A0ABD0K7W4_9CAEN